MTLQTNTLSKAEKAFAEALFKSYTSGDPLMESAWKEQVTNDSQAYRVQEYLTGLKDEEVGGYKVSLTSAETQKMFAADSPLYGAQVASHFLKSPATVSLQTLMEPLVEVELAFRAKEDLFASDSLEELMSKTTVAGGLEVPDSRFKDWFPTLSKYMVMSDAAVGGLVVYGQEHNTNELFSSTNELAEVTCELFHNGKKVKDGVSAEVLGNPLKSLHWLVQKLESQNKKFTAGQMVSSGTFVLPPKLTAGKWQVSFDHGLGSVTLKVTQ
ncbi:2-keto-4-pentenoate hydratase [Liquorilactobacillus capillatus]|uniref:2-oxo-hept-3-ene-1,7-dioate hydratase n=1 Tax=Liquorilactobacillus capillatus DSM 19910 TaxID=1423731 RepID=A0A0R1M359_9LACO|nr:2-keto-4-pentenoate hydratase [Liquorilactobacillus capillatus]KRL02455.1 2-oxo-hept-3-ene-1,7-dioate hydratase [Liquorilactobacillus capillatus DSM 19910]